MTTILSGPMFESAKHSGMKSAVNKAGGHCNIFYFDCDPAGRSSSEIGMQSLRRMFPDGVANEYNFVLFSTSGVHGTYLTIEEIENGLRKYPPDAVASFGNVWPDDYYGDVLTALIVHPRTVCLRCGNVRVTLDDIEYLKKLRQSSWDVVAKIGIDDGAAP